MQYTNVTYYSQLVVNFGALAQSKPNVGFVAQDGQTTVATLAAYPASDKPTTFDLNRFYFGCVGLTRVTTATGARKCDIQVTGYKLDPLQPAVKVRCLLRLLLHLPKVFNSSSTHTYSLSHISYA